MPSALRLPAVALLLTLPGCSAWLFSDVHEPDRSRPVVRVETRGGVELGAGTEYGVLFLGRTAQKGPCRVSWLLGGSVLQEEGDIIPYGSVFYRADIELKTQGAPILKRRPTADDQLIAMLPNLAGGVDTIAVTMGADGLLSWAGQTMQPGTPVFTAGDAPQLVGLIAAELNTGSDRRLVLAGLDQLREAWLQPREHPSDRETRFRPDDLIIRRPKDRTSLRGR